MTRSVSLDTYMVKHPVKIRDNAAILDAVDLLITNSVSGLCVMDENDQLVGVLSELDCLRAIIERVYDQGESDPGLVCEVMTSDVNANKPHDDIISVASSMLKNKQRRRPVLDGDELVGQVTCRQILGAIRSFADS
jgi:CBS domain-containing protein